MTSQEEIPRRASSMSTLDLESLAEKLSVIANENRLHLLRQLQKPLPVGEIRLLPPKDQSESGSPERAISRQAVRAHLDRLLEISVVARIPPTKESGRGDEYVVDHARLFALTEEIRSLNAVRSPFAPLSETLDGPPPPEQAAPREAHLLLVHGREEGRYFTLAPSQRSEGRGWVVGRRAGVAVPLEYDPFVSGENSEILQDPDGRFRILDLRSNRNGTHVNFRRLPRGASQPLRSGDVIGVGRSILVFRDSGHEPAPSA